MKTLCESLESPGAESAPGLRLQEAIRGVSRIADCLIDEGWNAVVAEEEESYVWVTGKALEPTKIDRLPEGFLRHDRFGAPLLDGGDETGPFKALGSGLPRLATVTDDRTLRILFTANRSDSLIGIGIDLAFADEFEDMSLWPIGGLEAIFTRDEINQAMRSDMAFNEALCLEFACKESSFKSLSVLYRDELSTTKPSPRERPCFLDHITYESGPGLRATELKGPSGRLAFAPQVAIRTAWALLPENGAVLCLSVCRPVALRRHR